MSESQKKNPVRYWLGKKHPHTEETKKKLRGRKFSEEHKKKLSLSRLGEKNHFWRGGISFEPYSVDWTETLKRAIRERDHYICQLCHKQQDEIAFPVHHINYNKKNCSPENLITLCLKCHLKTNHNRNHWKHYFGLLIVSNGYNQETESGN